MDALPSQLGRYEILGELATGGMAEILLGRLVGPQGFERVVVIKRILPHLARDSRFVAMFHDEARTAARIRHPNVIQVHELSTDGDEVFLVMEYLEGESLSGLLRRLRTHDEFLDPWLASFIVAEVCRGLHAAHTLQDPDCLPLEVVHRDVSPQNVFITYEGGVKVLDFGIAKAADATTQTEVGQVKGKFAYMSPEQSAGRGLDRRADIFALGAVFYETLVLRHLFKRATDVQTIKAAREERIVPPSSLRTSLPPALDSICLRALRRRREERFDTAADMRKELMVVMQRLNPEGDAPAALSELMHRLFAQRIEEKQEMLRRALTTSSSLAQVPAAEVDTVVELPPAQQEGDETAHSTSFDTGYTGARRKERNLWMATGLGLGVVITAATLYATRSQDADASMLPPPPPIVIAAPPVASAPAPAPAAEIDTSPPHPTAPTEIVISVESNPPADVTYGGRPAGKTPLSMTVPTSEAPVALVLQRAGYFPRTETVVPNKDQRLVLPLKPKASPRPPRPPKPTIEPL